MKRNVTESDVPVAASTEHVCTFCQEILSSRNKLFIHIRNTHAPGSSNDTSNAIESPALIDPVVAFEDEWCRVLIKPQGLPTMGSKGRMILNDPILLIKEQFKPHRGYRKAVPCHRLDSLTGGLLVCSKTIDAEKAIRSAFRNRLVKKRYSAICRGKLEPEEGIIDQELSGKRSVTRYKVVRYTESSEYGHITTVHLWPITGRKHQLRKHLQGLGHPIIGDKRYSSALSWSLQFPFLFLWAVEIALPHPEFLQSQLHRLDASCDKPSSESTHKAEEEEGDEEEDEGAEIVDPSEVSLRGENLAEAVKSMLAGMDSAVDEAPKLIHVTIKEPDYYERFCEHHRRSAAAAADAMVKK